MTDGRRHSVDIPISKTLVALRRVRSLRDPSTISMRKFSSLVDNENWEANSDNEISLQFLNDHPQGVYDSYGMLKSNNLSLYTQREDSRVGDFVGGSIRTKQVDNIELEPEDRTDQTAIWSKSHYNTVKPSESLGDISSQVGSPSQSITISDSPFFRNGKVYIEDHNHHGCAVSCCWSKTPRFRRSNLPSDTEENPLLSAYIEEPSLYENGRLKSVSNEIAPYGELPGGLSQKYRPKSFDDLVGQNVVARSLWGAILKRKISSFYLFHGPRGTGKTSTSRLFAAALNCLSALENRPCGLCEECVLVFSGRSRDVKEINSMRINKTERVRSLIKNAMNPPIPSRFKIFIIDECHFLRVETWATLLRSIENLSQHVVFVMVTPDLDKIPRSVVSRSQRYHFPKIRDADIATRLGKICLEEDLHFDQIALDFIAVRSSGSLRDAEMMLEQLSLLDKKITLPLAHELIGIVSDDELLELLDLALSSDTSNTVIRARELMRSRIDPMQLISRLANLIMDILDGKCEESCSEARRKFSSGHTAEGYLQKLSHALKILLETEKQFRISKNQTTWLTVALLQLSSVESSSLDSNESKQGLRNAREKDGEVYCFTSPNGEKMNNLVNCLSNGNKPCKLGLLDDCKGTLESIWKRVVELCQSNSLKNFLQKQGKLSSLSVNQGLAVAELQFCHPDHVSRAEKSWKLIASLLQSLLSCNVEISITLTCYPASDSKLYTFKKKTFSLFNCSRRMKRHSKSQPSSEKGSESDYYSNITPQKLMIQDTPLLTCSSDYGSQMGAVRKLRNSDGNVLSTRTTTTASRKSFQDGVQKTPGGFLVNSSNNEGQDWRCRSLSYQEERERRPNCFPKTLRLQKRLQPSEISEMICCVEQQN